MKKTYRIKTNNQEQLQRKQNESDATSRWIEFQKTRPRRRIQDKDVPVKGDININHEIWSDFQKIEQRLIPERRETREEFKDLPCGTAFSIFDVSNTWDKN